MNSSCCVVVAAVSLIGSGSGRISASLFESAAVWVVDLQEEEEEESGSCRPEGLSCGLCVFCVFCVWGALALVLSLVWLFFLVWIGECVS